VNKIANKVPTRTTNIGFLFVNRIPKWFPIDLLLLRYKIFNILSFFIFHSHHGLFSAQSVVGYIQYDDDKDQCLCVCGHQLAI